MSWLLLALGSALGLGAYDVTKKLALDGNAVLPTLLAATACGWLFLAALTLTAGGLATLGETNSLASLEVTPLDGSQHLMIFGKAVLVSSSWILSFFAVKHLPLSLAAPLRASSPLFTVVGAVLLLRERPSPSQWGGIFVTLGGYVLFAILGRREGVLLERNRWVGLLFVAILLGAASGVYDKFLLQQVDVEPTTLQFWFTTYNLAVQSVVVGSFWWPQRARTTPWSWRAATPWIGIFLVIADQLYFRALATDGALISVVSLLRRSSVVVTFAAGAVLLKEERLRAKAGALVVLLVGVFLMFQS